MTPVRDLMRQIEALRLEQMKHPERAEEIRAQREELRELLRLELHREHLRDMQLAQGLGECHFGSLDPMPRMVQFPTDRRQAWGSLLLAGVGTLVLAAVGVVALLDYFDVLTEPAPVVAKAVKR